MPSPIVILLVAGLGIGLGSFVTAWWYRAAVQTSHETEEQLRKLSRVVEQSASTVVITDLQGRIEYVNPKFTALTGYTPEEVYGKSANILKTGHTPDDEYARLWQTISAGGEWRGEFLNKKKNGDLYWETASISPIKNTRGEITHYLAVKEDITARKQTEQALQDSEAKNEAILTALPDLVFRLSRDGHYLDVRGDADSTLWMSNEPKNNTVGKSIFDVLPQPEAELIFATIQRALETGAVQVIEYRLPTMGGEVDFEARLACSGAHDVISVARDVSARKRAEAERERLIEELRAFAHTVAHNLKSPLHGIIGYASLVADDISVFSTEDLTEYLRIIERYGFMMSDIVDSLLLLASVREMSEVPVQRLEMAVIVKGALSRLRYNINERGAEIVVPDDGDWPPVRGYPAWVEEIWSNYISNALKYGGAPPRIELGASLPPDAPEGTVRFWVRDNGAGIAHDKQMRLFTPFTRLGEARVEGHGLGLSIVQRIAERMNGQVGVESAPGEGSLFYFTLPCLDDDEGK
jgi:PAS domain S-box-containing protein